MSDPTEQPSLETAIGADEQYVRGVLAREEAAAQLAKVHAEQFALKWRVIAGVAIASFVLGLIVAHL